MAPKRKAGSRRERALATRRRILEAAHGLFRSRGYAGTTMADVAKEAGVAVQTLYFTFHTKAAMLDEVIAASVLGFANWVPVGRLAPGDPTVLRDMVDWFAAAEAARTADGALEVFVTAAVEIMERTAPLISAVREASGDPDAKGIYELGESRRAQTYDAVVRVLAKKRPGLRAGLKPRLATDILLAIFSSETYQRLRERGWKPRDVRAWLLDVLRQQLLGGAG